MYYGFGNSVQDSSFNTNFTVLSVLFLEVENECIGPGAPGEFAPDFYIPLLSSCFRVLLFKSETFVSNS